MSTYASENGSSDDVAATPGNLTGGAWRWAATPGGLAEGTRRRAVRRSLEVSVAVVLSLAFVCCCSSSRAADVAEGRAPSKVRPALTGVEKPKFIPTPKSVTMDEGTMPLAAGSRIIATDPSLAPLAAVLSDEIWLLTDLKLAPGKGEARPGDIVLRIDPEIRAGADILAVQREGVADDPDAGMRAWTKRFARPFEARFVKLQGSKVYLKKADGRTTMVELRWLSDADKAIVKKLAAVGPKKKKPMKVVRTRDLAHTITISDTAVVAGWDYRAVCEGTATILQAIAGKEGKYFLPRMKIKDWPHADFTGCMVDMARQWIPIDAIKFTVEACRFWKVRYVHLHFSDNHAYTFPSKAFPELGNRNSASSGGIVPKVYNLEKLKELVAYADARGVTLVPELETPGHYGAMARSRGDLFGGPGCMPIASERLYGALDKIVGEMCDVFKSSPYFHIGCDECNWQGVGNSPQEKEYMSRHKLPNDTHPLNDSWQVYVYHAIRMARIVRKYGKMAIAWEGVADDGRAQKEGLIVMAWYNGAHCASLLSRGWTTITVPWSAGPLPQWSMYLANGHHCKRTDNVLGASRPMWQMSQFSLLQGYSASLCERQERTWGPDNVIADEAEYRKRMAASQERMYKLAAPARVVAEGCELLGMTHHLEGKLKYSGTMMLKLVAPFPTGGRIHYTLDGSEPTVRSPVYAKPLKMEKDFHLNAALFHGNRMLGSVNRAIYVWRDYSGWITEWMIAGPYTMPGKTAGELFNFALEPEKSGKAKWINHKGGGDAPWKVNLAGFGGFAGNHRVAYMRAQVHSPKPQRAVLEVTTDDGVKVWFNRKVLYGANTERPPFVPDRVKVSLKKGWNPILLKVLNFGGGWEAWVRVRTLDGKEMKGLRTRVEPEMVPLGAKAWSRAGRADKARKDAAAHLVTNGGFEEGGQRGEIARGWRKGQWGTTRGAVTARRDRTNSHRGQRSLVVRAIDEGVHPGAETTLTSALRPGKYQLRFWASADVGKTADVRAHIAGKDVILARAGGEWQEFSATVDIAEEQPRPSLRLYTTTLNVRIWFDDVEVKAVK